MSVATSVSLLFTRTCAENAAESSAHLSNSLHPHLPEFHVELAGDHHLGNSGEGEINFELVYQDELV
jgi:hypothetical protein